MEYKIGFIDSGCGSLIFAAEVYQNIISDLQAISKELGIKFTFYHLGDIANAPYGKKNNIDVEKLIIKSLDFMNENGVNITAIACNTALVNGFDYGGKNKKMHLLSILENSAKFLYKNSKITQIDKKNQLHLALFATDSTIKSNFYQTRLETIHATSNKSNAKLFIHSFSPKNWVNLIENGADLQSMKRQVNNDLLNFKTINKEYFEKISALGLFCTHFPFFTKQINNFFINCKIISQGQIFSKEILDIIKKDLKISKIIFKKSSIDNFHKVKIKSYVTGNNIDIMKRNAAIIAPKLFDLIII